MTHLQKIEGKQCAQQHNNTTTQQKETEESIAKV